MMNGCLPVSILLEFFSTTKNSAILSADFLSTLQCLIAGKTRSANYLPVDKTYPLSEGLSKKHKKWREMEVVKLWNSSSKETCSN